MFKHSSGLRLVCLLIPLLLICGSGLVGGERFRVRARLLTGAPAGVNYRSTDVVARGTYWAMLEKEEYVESLATFRRSDGSVPPALSPEVAAKSERRKLFRPATKEVAFTAEERRCDAAPFRLDDIRLAAYSDGRVLLTGRIKDLPKPRNSAPNATPALVKERTDGCRVTVFVRGYGSTESASQAVVTSGPMLFEIQQTFWVSKFDDYAISLVCPEEARLCRSEFRELTHIEVEMETRRNR